MIAVGVKYGELLKQEILRIIEESKTYSIEAIQNMTNDTSNISSDDNYNDCLLIINNLNIKLFFKNNWNQEFDDVKNSSYLRLKSEIESITDDTKTFNDALKSYDIIKIGDEGSDSLNKVQIDVMSRFTYKSIFTLFFFNNCFINIYIILFEFIFSIFFFFCAHIYTVLHKIIKINIPFVSFSFLLYKLFY